MAIWFDSAIAGNLAIESLSLTEFGEVALTISGEVGTRVAIESSMDGGSWSTEVTDLVLSSSPETFQVIGPAGAEEQHFRVRDLETGEVNEGPIPNITSEYQWVTARPGDPVTFHTGIEDDTAVIQWQLEFVAITGATGPDYVIPSVSEADAGVYSALALNRYGYRSQWIGSLEITNTPPPDNSLYSKESVEMEGDGSPDAQITAHSHSEMGSAVLFLSNDWSSNNIKVSGTSLGIDSAWLLVEPGTPVTSTLFEAGMTLEFLPEGEQLIAIWLDSDGAIGGLGDGSPGVGDTFGWAKVIVQPAFEPSLRLVDSGLGGSDVEIYAGMDPEANPIDEVVAITDENGNGVSDLWEQYYDILPDDLVRDLDGDGFDTEAEADFFTDPRDQDSVPLLVFKEVANQRSLEWQTVDGVRYGIETSADLESWIPERAADGDGEKIAVEIEMSDSELYWRLRPEGLIDRDGDGVGDWEAQIVSE